MMDSAFKMTWEIPPGVRLEVSLVDTGILFRRIAALLAWGYKRNFLIRNLNEGTLSVSYIDYVLLEKARAVYSRFEEPGHVIGSEGVIIANEAWPEPTLLQQATQVKIVYLDNDATFTFSNDTQPNLYQTTLQQEDPSVFPNPK